MIRSRLRESPRKHEPGRSGIAVILGLFLLGNAALDGGSVCAEERKTPLAGEPAVVEATAWSENQGELLYNGIRPPRQWPPRNIVPGNTDPHP